MHQSPLVELILGKKDDFGNWVGTAPDQKMGTRKKFVDVAFSSHNDHILMRIKIFAWIEDLPEYLVVVR